MEIIRRVICLDRFKSHIDGKLPFIPSEEPSPDGTNFGSFIYDSSAYGRTCNMMRKYNALLEILRTSVHLKRQSNYGCGDGGKSDLFFSKFEYNGTTEDFFNEPNLEVRYETEFTKTSEYTYTSSTIPNSCEYVILISNEDRRIYDLYGKIDFCRDVKSKIYTNNSSFNKVPYIPIHLAFNRTLQDVGTLTPYFDWISGEKTFKPGNTVDWYEFEESSGLRKGVTNVTSKNIEIESRLETLRQQEYISDDIGGVLPGIFEKFGNGDSTGQMHLCTYHTGRTSTEETLPTGYCVTILDRGTDWIDYSYWTISPSSSANLKCADDENVGPNQTKYRTLTVFETLTAYVTKINGEGGLHDGDWYYFLVKYNNTPSVPMKIPYERGMVFNKDFDYISSAYTGDYIKEITPSQDTITFTYVLGATFPNNTYSWNTATGGVIYKESYRYETSVEGKMNIDGFTDINYWYNKIDFDGTKEEISNVDFNLTRKANVSKVQQITLGDVWKQDGSVLNTMMFKEDYLMGISFDSKIDLDVEINRGNAAAFERHLRLSECNTLQDLEELGNNFYNI